MHQLILTPVVATPPRSSVTAVWLYFRFALSFRDIEELLAARGVALTYIEKLSNMLLVMFSATLLMLFSSLGQAVEAPDVTNPEVVEALVDGVLKPAMAKAHSSSGVVVVMKCDKINFVKGYGYIDVGKGIPVNPETNVFRTGSISGDEI
jgi:hypothetical protein